MSIRKLAAYLLALSVACCIPFSLFAQQKQPSLSETLYWMERTYNPHDAEGGGFGHGREENYSRGVLAKRVTETFSYDTCQLTLNVKDDPRLPLSTDMYSSRVYEFSLGDIDPGSITIRPYDSQHGGLSCDFDPRVMTCDMAEIWFETRDKLPLIRESTHTVFPKVTGSDHEASGQRETFGAWFYVDDADYAGHFAKALRHAVELCGGKPSPF